VIPVAPGWVIADLNVGILYIFAISSLGVYGIIMGGWASNSKYPFLGALRSAAQMVSYEVSIGFVIITVLLLRRFAEPDSDIVHAAGRRHLELERSACSRSTTIWCHVPDVRDLLHLGAGRDEPSAVRSAGSGIRTRRRLSGRILSTPYLLFMIGEYVAIIVLMCAMLTLLFFGGWHMPVPIPGVEGLPEWLLSLGGLFVFIGKVTFLFFMFAMVKAIVPRYRYDQLMRLGWKIFLPTSLVGRASNSWIRTRAARLRPLN
jgi:NADH-quinone oxidoreductase subunit H